MSTAGGSHHLPDLGPRGEGWVALQALLFLAVIGTGFLGPLWSDTPRLIGAIAGVVLMLLGGGLTAAGIVGLRRQLTPFPRPVSDGRLIDTGAFGLVRHPIYGGGIIAGLGWGLVMASPATLVSALVLLAFFDLKSRREEAWLEDQFAEYPAYRRRTRRLIPWLY